MFRVHVPVLMALAACFELRSQAILEDHWKSVVPEGEASEMRKAKPKVEPKAVEKPKVDARQAALRDRELNRLRRLLQVLEPYGDALDNIESPIMPPRAPLRRRYETGEAWMQYRTDPPLILPKRTPAQDYGREPRLPVHMFIIPLAPNLYDVRIHDPNDASLNPEHGLTVFLPVAPR